MRIFDVHVHYPSGFRFTRRSSPGRRPREQSPQERVNHMAQRLQRAGVVKAYLLVGQRFGGAGPFYEEALRTMEPHGNLFVPVAVVDPGKVTSDELQDLHDLGYRGLKIIGTEKDYDSQDYLPTYEKAEELGMPILFHMGVLGGGLDYARTHPRRDAAAAEQYQAMLERLANPPEDGRPGAGSPRRGNVSASRMRPFHLDTIANNFPKLKVIGAHLGGTGNYDESASVARWRHFVFFDLSGGEIIERHATERGYIGREIGVEKLVWGSDCSTDEVMAHVRRFETMFSILNLTEEEKDRIWYRNAAEIYGFEEPILAKKPRTPRRPRAER